MLNRERRFVRELWQLALLDRFHYRSDCVRQLFPLVDLNGRHTRLQFQHLAAVPN